MRILIASIILCVSSAFVSCSCSEDWLLMGNSCYLPVLNETTYSDATLECHSRHARFGNSEDYSREIMLRVIADLYDTSFWFDRNSSSDDCLVVKSTGIASESCNNNISYICHKLSPEPVTECKAYFSSIYFISSCIHIEDLQFNRSFAKQMCGYMGGHLLDIFSRYKISLARVVAMMRKTNIWVGSTEQEDEECMMVRLNDRNESEFYWSTSGCDDMTAGSICEFPPRAPVPATPEATTTEKVTLSCPSYHWRPFRDMCYWETSHETHRRSWEDAREFCQHYGGDLASYNSNTEERFALSSAMGIAKGMWMGLKKQPDKDDFFWSDGSHLNYTNWGEDEPKLSSLMNCVTHAGYDSHWEVTYCGSRRWFVCEIPQAQYLTTPQIEQPEEHMVMCDFENGYWYLHGDNCYSAHMSESFSWKAAKIYCEDHSAQLASIHSYDETDFILRLLDTYAADSLWSGLSAIGLKSSFSWSDGTAVDFVNWDYNANLQTGLMQRCVHFNSLSGFWNVSHCNLHLQFICKRKLNETVTSPTPTALPKLPGFCPSMWYVFGNRCYKPFGFQLSEKNNWFKAKEACIAMGATLAIIHSAKEQDFLTDLVLEIGYETWIGMCSSSEGSIFHWTDDSLIDYANWNEGEPSIYDRKEDCVEMIFGDENGEMGKWNDVNCNKSKGYICQRLKDPSLHGPGEDPTICPKANGWTKLSTSCYMLFRKPETWLDAQAYCRRYNATLTSVDNCGVSIFLQRLVIGGTENLFWLGVREVEAGSYRSFSPYPLYYTNWSNGQPKSVSEHSNCVSVTSKGQWSVADCNTKLPFFCQLYLDHIEQQPNVEEGTCPGGSKWHNVKGPSCFLFETKARVKWSSAVQKCLYYGGVLASFHTREQLDVVAPFIRGADFPLFIGLGRRDDGSYGWVDGSPFDLNNWENGEPNSADEFCVEMHTDVLTWNDISCLEERGYICSVHKIPFNNSKESKKIDVQRKRVEEHLAIGGIVGIVVCSMVVMVIAAVFLYYTCPLTSRRTRHLSEPETPLYECSSYNTEHFE